MKKQGMHEKVTLKATFENYKLFCKSCDLKTSSFKNLKDFLNLYRTNLYTLEDLIQVYKSKVN